MNLDPRLGEWIQPWFGTRLSPKENLVIAGCADDTGVRLNNGRAGAKDGPDSIRKFFSKMTFPMDLEWEKQVSLYDAGNILPATSIVETHRRCFALAKAIGEAGAGIIVLGGGHDFAAPNYLGFVEGWRSQRKTKSVAGLINIDPHLDVRVLPKNIPNSGTPFRQILESQAILGKNFIEFGTRANRNAREYYAFCRKHRSEVTTFESIRSQKLSAAVQFAKALKGLSTRCQILGTTFDMDSCSEAEGVSASPVLGFTAWELCQMAHAAGRERKVKYFEIAEVAPSLDPFERSSRIAAEMIYFFLRGRAEV